MNINKIVDLYKSKRLTQGEIAEKIGMSKTALSSILNGKSDPQVSSIERIAEALGVSAAYFFDNTTINGNAIDENVQYELNLLRNKNKSLENEIKLKDKIISMLENENKQLKNK